LPKSYCKPSSNIYIMKTRSLSNWKKGFLFRNLSIRQRLPLLICILLLALILTFSLVSYIGVKNAALKMGRERLQTLTEQLSSMFGQSAQTITTATHTAATQESFKKYIQSASGRTISDTAAITALQKVRTDSTWVLVQLLNADHKPLLQSGLPGININVNLDSVILSLSLNSESCKIGNLYRIRDSIYYPIVATIAENNRITGYLMRWRLQKATPKAIAQFSQLLGDNTTLYVGNADGSLWSDLNKAVSSPPVDLQNKSAFSEYSRPQANRVIATVRPIVNTPWILLLEVSHQRILEAANRFLRWVIIVGVVLLAAGIFFTWVMSRHITDPLKKLTTAATSITDGHYSGSVHVNRSDELGKLGLAFNAMIVEVNNSHHVLEKKVQERTAQLEKANKELEAFSYSVSHDLRAPLRAINGYAIILKEEYASKLDAEANRITDKIIRNAKMMGQLIDDLIAFSKMGGKEVMSQMVDMKKLVQTCFAELLPQLPENKYQVQINSMPPCNGDESLLKQVWLNLISNALKYSSKNEAPCIEIGWKEISSGPAYYIMDNGVGFDMQYADKLFGVFQRLHSEKDFEGTGVGLALVKRIINQHKGEVWAESSPGEGAAFFFSLSLVKASVTENNLV
jgi:signal transduction histidine kinase